MGNKLAALAFIFFFIWLMYSDQTREVEVHICEANGVSTYVNRNPPPSELVLGECKIKVMRNERYYYLRQIMRRGAK